MSRGVAHLIGIVVGFRLGIVLLRAGWVCKHRGKRSLLQALSGEREDVKPARRRA